MLSTVRLRRLAAELTRRREAAGLTREEAAERLQMSPSTIYRIETAQARPQARTMRDLLDLYGVTGAERDALVTIAREAGQRSWWHAYSDVLSAKYSTFIGLEAGATVIRNFEPLVVPGLMQTEDYARAVVRGGPLELDPTEVDVRVEVRMARQDVMAKEDRPRLWAILDEAVLRRCVGGPEVMRAQLRRLAEISEWGRTTLQVVPFSAGAHPGTSGPFIILEFGDAAPETVYVETAAGDLYLEQPEDVARYNLAFDHLRASALPVEESRALIARAAEELS